MSLTVSHLRVLLDRPECRDDMPVVIYNTGTSDFTERDADAAIIDVRDRLVITVDPELVLTSST